MPFRSARDMDEYLLASMGRLTYVAAVSQSLEQSHRAC